MHPIKPFALLAGAILAGSGSMTTALATVGPRTNDLAMSLGLLAGHHWTDDLGAQLESNGHHPSGCVGSHQPAIQVAWVRQALAMALTAEQERESSPVVDDGQ